MKTVLAVCGSIRNNSSNHRLIKAIADLYTEELHIELFGSVALLPHFNPDEATEQTPEVVLNFREQLCNAAGIIICTPEYAHGVPGVLKNAIDWTVGSGEFSGKPVLLITASTDGRFAHESLCETLRVLEAKEIDQLNLLIPFVQTKISPESKITDESTLTAIKMLMQKFIRIVNGSR